MKVTSISDTRISSLTRIGLINPGVAKIVVYDSGEKKYHSLKDVSVNPTEKVIYRLKTIFGDDAVVVK